MLPREGRGHWIRQGIPFAFYVPRLESDKSAAPLEKDDVFGGEDSICVKGSEVYTLHGVFRMGASQKNCGGGWTALFVEGNTMGD